jgi:hypothetical protein
LQFDDQTVLINPTVSSPFVKLSRRQTAPSALQIRSAFSAILMKLPLTLNQRVQGSSPCAPTNKIRVKVTRENPNELAGVTCGVTIQWLGEMSLNPTPEKALAVIFRQINRERLAAHHDALEFPDGQALTCLTKVNWPWFSSIIGLPAARWCEPASAYRLSC